MWCSGACSPWWSWCGGLTALFTIAASIQLFKALGQFPAALLPMLGQLLFSLVIDSFGLFGARVIPLSAARALAACLLIAGTLSAAARPNVKAGAPRGGAGGAVRLWQTVGVGAGCLMATIGAIYGSLGTMLGSAVSASAISFAAAVAAAALFCMAVVSVAAASTLFVAMTMAVMVAAAGCGGFNVVFKCAGDERGDGSITVAFVAGIKPDVGLCQRLHGSRSEAAADHAVNGVLHEKVHHGGVTVAACGSPSPVPPPLRSSLLKSVPVPLFLGRIVLLYPA